MRADGKPLPDTLAMEGHEEAIEYNKEYVISVKAAYATQYGTENKTLKLTVGDEEEADKFASQTYVVTWEYTSPGEGADLEQMQEDLEQTQEDLAQAQADLAEAQAKTAQAQAKIAKEQAVQAKTAQAQALLEEVLNWTAQADPAQAAEGTPGAQADLTQVRAELAKAKEKLAKAEKVIKEIVGDLTCPISQAVFVDPVICSDGHTYSRDQINKWFSTNLERKSPLTGVDLQYWDPVSNMLAKKVIDALKENGYSWCLSE